MNRRFMDLALVFSVGLAAVGPLRGQVESSLPAEEEVVGGTLLEIVAETLVIGKAGSRRAGSDRVVLPPGKVGLLRTVTALPARADAAQEDVSIDLEVRAERRGDTVHLHVDSTARPRLSGEVVRRSGGGALSGNGPLLYEAYVSLATGERVVFLLDASPWKEKPRGPIPTVETAPRAVAYQLKIYRLTPAGPEFLDSPSLGSLVGHAATYSFGFRLAPQGEVPRQERLLVRVKSVELRDGWLTGMLTLEGNVAGAPVRQARSWSLPSGGVAEIDLELGDRAGEELGFRIVVAIGF